MGTLEQTAVKGFGYPIMLRGIGGGETALGSLLSQIRGELITGELTTAIRAKAFNMYSMLCLRPSTKGLVCLKGFVLGLKNF